MNLFWGKYFNGCLTSNLLCFIALNMGVFIAPVHAEQHGCINQLALQHTFDTGAAWSLCASVSDVHGLTINSVHYRAPGDSNRSVLSELYLGQLLLHYHDNPTAEPQITPTGSASDSTSHISSIVFNENTCNGELISVSTHPSSLCIRVKNNRILAKYAQRPSLQSQSWEIASAFTREALTWTVAVTFAEDGQIRPSVSLSGRAMRTGPDSRYSQSLPINSQPLTRASVLATWRLHFDLDTRAIDRVEQFEFPLDVTHGNRRPQQLLPIDTETLRHVHRENFRGWRIVDVSGAGYYLDPANSGFSYTNPTMHWAQFDFAVTRLDACEKHALLNIDASGNRPCGTSLDDFINGESLHDAQPVLWYSLSRIFNPSLEDWPVISDLRMTFDLLPFDWTASSPFELIE